MAINRNLSLKGCWRLVNACQNGKTADEIRERCKIAADWLKENEVISAADFDELMDSLAFLVWESYR